MSICSATRHSANPLITPADVPPSHEGLEVTCVMNAGALKRGSTTYLMLRVDERPLQEDGYVSHPVSVGGQVQMERYSVDMPGLDLSDSRAIMLPDGRMRITVLSHLRLARSEDGVHFKVDPDPTIFPTEPWESFGAQDSRMTEIDGTVYVNYSAVSEQGVGTALASTTDMETFERHGLIFLPDNRNVCLFPRKIDGQYLAMSRPMHSLPIGRHSIWLSRSPDLKYWGDHHRLMGPRDDAWDSYRVGGGAPPIETEAGWLLIYHGATEDDRYCLGAALLDPADPRKVLSRLDEPILQPEAPYECEGFFDDVVFTDGAVVEGETLRIYYGASDEVTCLAEMDLPDLLEALV